MQSSMIKSVAEDFGNGGTIDGDITITGDLQVNGGGSLSFDEIVQGTQVIDVTNTEALLVRKNDDGGDVFVVDTTNSHVGICSAIASYTDAISTSQTLSIGENQDSSDKLASVQIIGRGSSSTDTLGALEFINTRSGSGVVSSIVGGRFNGGSASDGSLSFNTKNGSSLTTKMTINDVGSVGIGTTSPSWGIETGNFRGTNSAPSFNGTGDGFAVDVYNGGNPYPRYISLGALGASTATAQFDFYADAGSSMVKSLSIKHDAVIVNENSADVDFRVESDANTHAFFVEGSSGNVGIGTDSPTHNLSVYNDGGATSVAIGKYDTNKTVGLLQTNQDSDGYFRIQSYARQGSTFGKLILNEFGGNVGIGTNSPVTMLNLKGDGTSIITLETSDTTQEVNNLTGAIYFRGNDATSGAGGTRAMIKANAQDSSGGHYMSFATAPSASTVAERVRIDMDGNVNIGSTSSKTNNVGSSARGITIANATTPVLSLWDTTNAGYHSHFYQVEGNSFIRSSGSLTIQTNAGTTALTIDTSQRVGIGTTSPAVLAHFSSSSANQVRIERTTSGNSALHYKNSGEDWYSGVTSSSNFSVSRNADIASGTEFVIRGNTGNIGIGTSNPAGLMHLTSSSTDGNIIVESTHASSSGVVDIRSVADRDSSVLFREGTTVKARIRNDASADALVLTDGVGTDTMHIKGSSVGIGTDSPSGKLHVKETAGDEFFTFANSNGIGLVNNVASHGIGISASQSGSYGGQGSSALIVTEGGGSANAGTVQLVHDGTIGFTYKGGNVGIGRSTNIDKKLHILSSTSGDGITLEQSSTGSNAIRFEADSSALRGLFGSEDSDGGAILSGSSGYSMVLRSESDIFLATNGNNEALKIDTSQNATFNGDITISKSSSEQSIVFRDSVDAGKIVYSHNNEQIQFRVGGTGGNSIKARIRIGGDLYLDGGQITFPATQVGSSGANTLDDYEEGDYDTTVTCGTSGTITLNSANNRLQYVKIGKMVSVTGQLSVASVSSPVGYFTIALPFAIGDGTDTAGRSCGSVTVHNANAILSRDFVNIGVEGESSLRVYVGDASGLQSDSANGVIANTAIHVSFTYHV